MPAGLTAEQVKANIAAGYSLSYILSILGIVLLVRNLPAMFGIDPVEAARESEKRTAQRATRCRAPARHSTSACSRWTCACLPARQHAIRRPAGAQDVRARSTRRSCGSRATARRRAARRRIRRSQAGDLLTVAGAIAKLLGDSAAVGPEVDDEAARHFDVDQAEIVLARQGDRRQDGRGFRRATWAMYGVRLRALFRDGHELPLLPGTPLQRHDVVRVIGMPSAAAAQRWRRSGRPCGRPTPPTSSRWRWASRSAMPSGSSRFASPAFRSASAPWAASSSPAWWCRFCARSTRHSAARCRKARVRFSRASASTCSSAASASTSRRRSSTALSQGMTTIYMLLLGLATATIPTFISWLVGLYVLKMDPIILAGCGRRRPQQHDRHARHFRAARRAPMPAFGYPVTYALSTVVFLVYGYLAMLLTLTRCLKLLSLPGTTGHRNRRSSNSSSA